MAKKKLDTVQKRIARVTDYKRVFSTEQGKRVLQDLIAAHFVMRPTMNKDLHLLAFNEGQRNVVLRIMTILEVNEEEMQNYIRESNNGANESVF